MVRNPVALRLREIGDGARLPEHKVLLALAGLVQQGKVEATHWRITVKDPV